MYKNKETVENEFDEKFNNDSFVLLHEEGVNVKLHISHIRNQDLESLKEFAQDLFRLESDYDDEDKKARRDVRPFNEALTEIITHLNSLSEDNK